MVSLLKTTVRLASAVFATGLLVAASQSYARPGTVNYTEGSVKLAGQSIGAKQIGQSEVAPGQVLETSQGKAEMLLTPGVLLRLNDNSAARMISASLTDTRVELMRGEAMIEAQQVQKENRISVVDHGVETLIEKNGIYRFDADRPMVSVFDGKVKVLADDRTVEVGKGKELALGAETKPHKFDRDQTDNLYNWSKLRSSYMAEANQSYAQTVIVTNPGWYGNGWYWNPWYHTWAFVPSYGYLTSPFGFGFYSPGYWYGGGPVYVRPVRPGVGGVWRGPSAGGFNRGGVRVPPSGGRTLGRGARM
jgi:hypothetical protein